MKNVKAQATLKIREAMSGLREAMKTASPTDRRAIHACMSELRAIKADLDEAPAVIEEVGADEAPDAMEVVNEADSLDGDEELALSALELAASALKAAAEEDAAAEEGAATEDEEAADEDSGDEESESEDAEADEDKATEDDAEAGEEAADAEGSDVDALTDKEIAALEAEGLLEGSAVFKRSARKPIVRKPVAKVAAKVAAKPVKANSVEGRLARVQARLNTLLAEGEEMEVLEDSLDDEEIEEDEFNELDSDDDFASDDEIVEDESMSGEGIEGEDLDEDFADFEGESEDDLLNEDEAELTPEEVAMLEEMGIGLEASTLILAASNVLWAAKKRKKATKGAKIASAKKWKGAKIVGRSAAKRTKKGKFYVVIYRKKGNLSGSFNLFFAKKPTFKKLKVPKGATKAVAQRIAKHNKVASARLMKESPSQAKKK